MDKPADADKRADKSADGPVDKSVHTLDKPADKPVDKSSDVPVDKSSYKPADQTVVQLVEKSLDMDVNDFLTVKPSVATYMPRLHQQTEANYHSAKTKHL